MTVATVSEMIDYAKKSRIISDTVIAKLSMLLTQNEPVGNQAIDATMLLLGESMKNGDQERSPALIAVTISNCVKAQVLF